MMITRICDTANLEMKVHLGDYIYESTKGKLGQDPRATNPSREIVTLYGS